MKVLDKGHLILDAVYGSEADIVSAARVCTSTECTDSARNDGLLEYLIRNGHTSPLEMMTFRFRVKAPIFVARQWMRHRTWSYNEVSMRYKNMAALEFYNPGVLHNKNNNGRALESTFTWANSGEYFADVYSTAADAYYQLIELGFSFEQARIVLPVATYTEFVCSVDLSNLLKFLEQRMHPRAQWEIRQYANIIANIVKEQAPTVWRCFVDKHPEIELPGHSVDVG
jgi:thymidylate synthase (FAD)